jgi:GTP-binding protein Era
MKAGSVALIGRPNVGKSTLLNSLLGQKVAIVSDKPQTTRISILGIKTTEKGQIIFVDNPGIHKPLHTLNERMMSFVYSALETSDLICLLIDATERFGHGDEFVIETLKKVTPPLFLLINKVDIVKKENILLIIDKYKDLLDFKEIIPISALRGTNLDVLEKEIYACLPEAEKLYDDETVTQLPLRFRLAEIIREKLLKRVEKELPFVTAVLVERLEERGPRESAGTEATGVSEFSIISPGLAEKTIGPGEKQQKYALESGPAGLAGQSARKLEPSKKKKQRRKVTYISAMIFVERDNHRKIVIGRQGQVIKMIGIEARREIEQILDSKVFLDLKVKVKEKWRDSPEVLDLIEGQR